MDLEPLVKAMYRKLEPLFYVLTFNILHDSKDLGFLLCPYESIGIGTFP